jgi:hypothetical protein
MQREDFNFAIDPTKMFYAERKYIKERETLVFVSAICRLSTISPENVLMPMNSNSTRLIMGAYYPAIVGLFYGY